jgi:hypothetical protein
MSGAGNLAVSSTVGLYRNGPQNTAFAGIGFGNSPETAGRV